SFCMNFYDNISLFDKYKIIQQIGETPFYSDYLGIVEETGKNVYIKMINPEKFTRYEVDKICFGNECVKIKTFESPYILKLYDAGGFSNTVCIVSEYISGFMTLRQYLENNSNISLSTALDIIEKLATGLNYAHSKNILHRGVRAANIGIIEREDGQMDVKLFDFGVSQIIDYSNTSAEYVDENFGFMAPENTGLLNHKVDCRSDLYSLGILLYRFLTGHYPFHADTIDNMVYQHVAVMPKEPTDFNPAIPTRISDMTMKLLAKEPDLRFRNAFELINEIDEFKMRSGAGLDDEEESGMLLQNLEQRARLISRKKELTELRNYYTQALKNEGRFCLVQGDANSGKSDLITNLCSELEESKIPFFRASFIPQKSGTPRHAFRDILLQYINIYKKYDHKMASTERTRLFEALSGQSELVFKVCSEMMAVLPEQAEITELDQFRENQRATDRLSSFFLQLYEQGKPFIIVLDDLHYADAASLSLLINMAGLIRKYKVFIVCSMLTTFDEENSLLKVLVDTINDKSSNAIVMTLTDFDHDRMTEFIAELLLISKKSCAELVNYILENTGGNSYFACNLIRSMLENGSIAICDRQIEVRWDKFENTNIDISELVEKRVDNLSKEAIEALDVASIIGSDFSSKLLSAVLEISKEEVNSRLSEALDQQLIEYSSTLDGLCFTHHDIQQVFINHLSDSQKRSLHLKIAKCLETLNPDIDKAIFEIFYHYLEADSTADLKKVAMRAGNKAREANANEDAIKYYRKEIELVSYDEDKANWLIAKQALVELNLMAGHYDDAISAAQELLGHMDDALAKAKLLHRIAMGFYRQSDFESCRKYLLAALEELKILFPDGTKASVLIRILSLKTKISSLFISDYSKIDEKNTASEKASLIVSIYEVLCWVFAYSDITKFEYVSLKLYTFSKYYFGASKEFALANSALSMFYMLGGDKKRCTDTQLIATKLRNKYNDTYGQARSELFSGFALQTESELEHSVKHFKTAAATFKTIGDSWEYNNALMFMLYSHLMSGEYATCVKKISECKALSEKLGDQFTLARCHALLVECYTQMGNYPMAEVTAKESRAFVESLDFPYASAAFYLAYGKLMFDQLKYSEATQLLSKATDLIDEHSLAPVYLASAYSYLAMSKVGEFSHLRGSMSLTDITVTEKDISAICDKAKAVSKHVPNAMIAAQRAQAAFGIVCGKFKIADSAFTTGTKLISNVNYKYECAMLEYEYGQYLLSKHRMNEARFQIFEAYMNFTNISSDNRAKECEKIINDKYSESFRDNSLMQSISSQRVRMNVDRKANTLLRLGERLTSTLELDELQKKILQDAVEMVGAERGILFLYPETGVKKLYVASVYNLGNFDGNTYEWMLQEVEKSRKPIVINDVQSDEYRKHYSIMANYGIKSVMAQPMFVRGSLFGVIYLDSRLVRQIFTDEYTEAMGFIANQAGAPIENARLYRRAITDGLTGINGRSYLDNLIVDKTSEENPQLSAIMIDVDHFKNFNDTYGHQFGDKVLKQIAGIMKRDSGELGTPCRYGGEEFVILLNSNDVEYALSIAEKVRADVEATELAYNNGSEVQLVSVTISLGVSIWDPKTMERLDLIEHADKALYFAKHNGRNQVKLWDASID
ncbi:MAG: diguanylate cyclase, partial [Lachnospiraceae bacterium]|nr:diguanylate cyclase [Lachnospiraceae bacterium]